MLGLGERLWNFSSPRTKGCPISRSFFARCGRRCSFPLALAASKYANREQLLPHLAKNEREMGPPLGSRRGQNLATMGSHALFYVRFLLLCPSLQPHSNRNALRCLCMKILTADEMRVTDRVTTDRFGDLFAGIDGACRARRGSLRSPGTASLPSHPGAVRQGQQRRRRPGGGPLPVASRVCGLSVDSGGSFRRPRRLQSHAGAASRLLRSPSRKRPTSTATAARLCSRGRSSL